MRSEKSEILMRYLNINKLSNTTRKQTCLNYAETHYVARLYDENSNL